MILNLTQHESTADQRKAGVVDLKGKELADLRKLLTFDTLPSAHEIEQRAEDIAELAIYNGLGGDDGDDPRPHAAMIGGAPFLMAALERALWDRDIEPRYAFSLRRAVEEKEADGTVFEHLGFVTPLGEEERR